MKGGDDNIYSLWKESRYDLYQPPKLLQNGIGFGISCYQTMTDSKERTVWMIITENPDALRVMMKAVDSQNIKGYKVKKMYYRKGDDKPYEVRTTEIV